jgi:ubiquinone/menaquinone biosynthesis C-methylase UbiE
MPSNSPTASWWSKRSKQYDKLSWVQNKNFLHACIDYCKINARDFIWDAGCGTGTFAIRVHKQYPSTCIIGTDNNSDMLKEANKKRLDSFNPFSPLHFINHDLCSFEKPHFVFGESPDIIFMRNVLHHLSYKQQFVISRMHDMLKVGGRLVVVSPVPPGEHLKKWYEQVFYLKDHRTVIWPKDLITWFKIAGFNNIEYKEFRITQSVKNWLDNNSLPWLLKRKIYKMHLNLDDEGKKLYNMQVIDNGKDIIIEPVFFMIRGYK